MKEDLKKIIQEFVDDVETHNRERKGKPGSALDDDVELTFENFIKWITFK